MELQINNPNMLSIFRNEFHSNQEQFMQFILSFMKDNKEIFNSYFEKDFSLDEEEISFKKLNPMENFYILSKSEVKFWMDKKSKKILPKKDSLVDFFQNSPLVGVLPLEREKDIYESRIEF